MKLSPEEQTVWRAFILGDDSMISAVRQMGRKFIQLNDNVFQPIGDRFRIGNSEYTGKRGLSQVHTALYAAQRYEQDEQKVSVRELNGDPLLASGDWEASADTGILVPADDEGFCLLESDKEKTDEDMIRWMIEEEERLRTDGKTDSDKYRWLRKELNHETFSGKIMYRAETKTKRAVKTSIKYALNSVARSDDVKARLIAEHLQEYIIFSGDYVHYTGTWTWALF